MTPNAARAAAADQKAVVAKNLVILGTLVAADRAMAPRVESPRFYVPPNTRVSSTTRCWIVKLLDQFGKPREGFMRGPTAIAEAAERANDIFKNWTIISINPTLAKEPPSHARGVPASASDYGVMKSLHARRRR